MTLQALLHCAAEIREAVAMQPIWSPECDTARAPHRSSLGELDWREEMHRLTTEIRQSAAAPARAPLASSTLRAPFPWFGGKSRVAPLVWQHFGPVANYIEPFAGSLAVLLGRPAEYPPGIETVNDLDHDLANFWRALAADPEAVAAAADYPVNECDLLARHRGLLSTGAERIERLRHDPEFYDAKVAGWWVWGLCAWIGDGWCVRAAEQQLPHLGDAGQGINRGGGAGLAAYFSALAARLRRVRVACGDWQRVLGESVTHKNGLTGVFLDPPYAAAAHDVTYAAGGGDVSGAVREWAIANGGHPKLRIALCGYEGEHTMPADWACVPWKAAGGFGSQAKGRGVITKGRENAHRERIWFSPHCLGGRQASLF